MNSSVARAPSPPCNIEAEQQLIGAALINNDLVDRVNAQPDDFYDPLHAEIWRSIVRRVTNGEQATPVLLRPEFSDHPGIADVGGVAYLARLAGAAVAIVSAPDYAKQIAGLARRREILTALDSASMAVASNDDAETVAAALEAEMMVIHDRARPKARAKSIARATVDMIDAMSDAYHNDRPSGTPCGIAQIDEHVGGMVAPEIWTLAGRSSMGKTAIALHICKSVALQGVPVLFFSLEMDPPELSQRITSSLMRGRDGAVPYQKMRMAHRLSETEMRCCIETAREAGALPIHISPPSLRSLGGIRAEARAVGRRVAATGKRLGLICVDYIQRVQAPGDREHERIAAAMAGMKDLAVTHNCPVLSLAQLNRDVERRASMGDSIPRPRLSDLQGSGSLEQDSDVVILAQRDEYYFDRMKPPEDEHKRSLFYAAKTKAAGKLQLQIAKFRNGAVDEITCDCDMAFNSILPPAAQTADPELF